MDDYYCRLCGTVHVNTEDDITCPTCKSRYCLLSIKTSIEENGFHCAWCPERLIETLEIREKYWRKTITRRYGEEHDEKIDGLLLTTELDVLKELEEQLGNEFIVLRNLRKNDARIVGFRAWNYRVIELYIIGQYLEYRKDLTIYLEICSKLTRLEKLFLTNNGLTSLPESFKQLSNLRSLRIAGSNIDQPSRAIIMFLRKKGCSIHNMKLKYP